MSNALLDALESKLLAAVETIDTLRRELNDLKDERRLMEDKLRTPAFLGFALSEATALFALVVALIILFVF